MIMYFFNLLLLNTFFNSFLFERLFQNEPSIAEGNLISLQNDFIKIGFPYSFSLNVYFVAFFVALFSTIVIYYILPKSISLNSPIQLIKEFLKIMISYSGVLLSSMYLLRLFNFSRGYILIAIIIYPFISYLLIWFLRLEKYKNTKFKFFASAAVLIVLSSLLFSLRENDNIASVTIPSSSSNTVVTLGEVESDCFEWSGSDNFKDCISGIELVSTSRYSKSLNNVIVFENDLYVLDVYGVVYKNSPDNIFLDISDKVINRLDRNPDVESEGDAGLFSLSFHPTQNYFLVSYSDLEDNLIIEKYFTNEKRVPILENSEVILRIPNSANIHYSGNLIWSNYFSDFVLSVGDMRSNLDPLRNSEPLDTTSPRGKILLINKEVSNPELITLDAKRETNKNILAYGLRNPWKTFEYENYLFVLDIGLIDEEELNILNLDEISNSKKPYLLGWPHFEGTINNNVKFNQILLHRNGKTESINKFIIENSISPKVYYSHQAPENFRAAIIGGAVIDNPESKYFEHYFFADYLSNELFSYDFRNDELFIFPLGSLNSFITSLTIHPSNKDSILLTTGSGNLVELKLP